MASVFLSYSREDLASARPIASALEEAGHSVWWDREIKGGAQYAKEIDQALAAADKVMVLWSEHSIESAWVRDEAEAGRDSGRLVPLTLDGSRPPLGFRQYQTVDLSHWRKSRDASELGALLALLDTTSSAPSDSAGQKRRVVSRRTMLTAGGSAAVLAALGGGWALSRKDLHPKPPPEVESLMVQARQLQEQNSLSAQNQAVGLYERAVKLAPSYADAWGRLGVICAVCSHYRERPEALRLRAKGESAGNRALQLDRANVYGQMALAIARPFIGYWAEWDRRMTAALAKEPRNDDVLTYRAVMLQFEGRAAESVPLYQRISERPMRPAVYTNYLKALWTSGHPVELDDAMDDAASLYPSQPSIWFTRFQIFAFSGRTGTAIAMAEDSQGRPELDDKSIAYLVKLARAIGDPASADRDSVMAEEIDGAHSGAGQAEVAIRNASALGRVDDAFRIADAYYFGHGFTIPDFPAKGSVFSPDQRQTRLLFEPVTAPMRADRRFEPLVAQLGLDRYWRQSGIAPDYRRT